MFAGPQPAKTAVLAPLVLLAMLLPAPAASAFTVPDSPIRPDEDVVFTTSDPCAGACTWTVLEDAGLGAGASFTHQFAAPGAYTVTLVIDPTPDPLDAGDEITESETVTVVANQPPGVTLSPPGGVPTVGAPVTVTATADDAEDDPLTYAWSVNGGALPDTGPSATFTPTAGGAHTVAVTVSDDHGGSTPAELVVDVNTRPQAAFTFSPASPNAGEEVTLTSTSADADNDDLTYAWSVPDGVPRTGVSTTFTPGSGGVSTVTLTVTDEHGATDSQTQDISVNAPPVASFTHAPEFPVADQTITLTSTSTDAGNAAEELEYAWTVDGKALVTSPPNEAKFTPPASGTYEVRLVVTDRNGATDEELRQLEVYEPSVATIGVTPLTPVVGELVTMTATIPPNADPDGDATLEWRIDDGPRGNAGATTITHRFTSAGVHQVTVFVRDEGRPSPTTAQIIVTAPPAPPAPPPAPVQIPVPVPVPVAVGSDRAKTTASAGALTLMKPFPRLRVAGSFSRRGARLTRFAITAPTRARIRVGCSGRGCRFSNRSARRGRLRVLEGRLLRAGVRITVRITSNRRREIGKYVSIKIRSGRPPLRTDRCLKPGTSKPMTCPTE